MKKQTKKAIYLRYIAKLLDTGIDLLEKEEDLKRGLKSPLDIARAACDILEKNFNQYIDSQKLRQYGKKVN